MKITLILVGKTNESYINEAIQVFENRLKHYVSFSILVIPELKNSGKISVTEQKNKEGELIFKQLNTSSYVVLLDEKGKEFSSLAFADYMQKQMNSGIKNLVFVIGGAFGFSDKVYERANAKIAISKMTFTHQLVRIFFVEQLYRAFTIIKGESYHHE